MTSHIEPGMLALAQNRGVDAMKAVCPGCTPSKILKGNTKRGPAFVYACDHCARVFLIDIPVSGLRSHEPGDPSHRTHVSAFALSDVIIEIGAFVASDGTARARFVLRLPHGAEPEWDVTTDSAAEVGEAVKILDILRKGESGYRRQLLPPQEGPWGRQGSQENKKP
jgi:hypothetical protein